MPTDQELWAAKVREQNAILAAREKDVQELLWLHAEAAWQRDDARTVADRLGWLLVEARAKTAEVLSWHEAERSSRQAWAEEALRLDQGFSEAVELLKEILPYVPEYFQEKWDYPAEIAALDERVRAQ